jgi:hypothetical protein
MRAYRIGKSSGNLPWSDFFNNSIGSNRLACGTQFPCAFRVALLRSALPTANLSLTEGPGSLTFRPSGLSPFTDVLFALFNLVSSLINLRL